MEEKELHFVGHQLERSIYEIASSDLPVAIGQDFMKLRTTGTINE